MEKRIVVVEDDKVNLKLIVDLLQMAGYQTFAANNGAEGVQLVLRHQPHLVIMDIQMPVMDGMEAARLLKGDAATQKIPIIALTGFAMPADEIKFREAGCDGYLTKPIDIEGFYDEVASFVGQFPGNGQ